MRVIILCLIHIGFLFYSNQVKAQGCVAIRGLGSASCINHESSVDTSSWSLTINNRYFKSYKHFVGMAEQKERVENGTEVINHTFSTDFFIQKNINSRLSLAINIPLISNARSSLYEHGGNTAGPSARHNTHSFGLGDIRVAGYYWLKDPFKASRWNMQAGVGIKLATGDYRYSDYFVRNDTTKILGPVDQSIQLGDGGTGLTFELSGYYAFNHAWSLYGNFFYMANPREQNGVSTARGGVSTPASIAYGSNVMSVADQYMYRAGISYMGKYLTGTLGIRKDGIPSVDLIGGSNGFRRPGYVVAVEPGLSYMKKKVTYFLNLPISVQRNRTQSVPDKIRTEKTGVYFKGDAAFADYLVNAGVVLRF
jgi:hypothetical protein